MCEICGGEVALKMAGCCCCGLIKGEDAEGCCLIPPGMGTPEELSVALA